MSRDHTQIPNWIASVVSSSCPWRTIAIGVPQKGNKIIWMSSTAALLILSLRSFPTSYLTVTPPARSCLRRPRLKFGKREQKVTSRCHLIRPLPLRSTFSGQMSQSKPGSQLQHMQVRWKEIDLRLCEGLLVVLATTFALITLLWHTCCYDMVPCCILMFLYTIRCLPGDIR